MTSIANKNSIDSAYSKYLGPLFNLQNSAKLAEQKAQIPVLKSLGFIMSFAYDSSENYKSVVINGERREQYETNGQYKLFGIGKNVVLFAEKINVEIGKNQAIKLTANEVEYLPKEILVNNQTIEANLEKGKNTGIYQLPKDWKTITDLKIALPEVKDKNVVISHPQLIVLKEN